MREGEGRARPRRRRASRAWRDPAWSPTAARRSLTEVLVALDLQALPMAFTPRRARRPASVAVVGRAVAALRQVFEPGEPALEVGLDRGGRAVAVLADDHLGDVRVVGLLVVDHVAVDEEDDVGVLLDSAGLAQVRELGALVGALLE